MCCDKSTLICPILSRHSQFPPMVEGVFIRASAPRQSQSCIGMIAVSIVMFIAIFTKTNILNNNGEVVPYKTVFNKNYEIR